MEYSINIWKGEFLGSEVCVDVETTIAPFHTRDHKLVCFQAYGGGDKAYFVRLKDIRRFFNKHYVSTFILQNATFDISVLLEFGIPKDIITEIYDENRIRDTKILYSLYILASRGYIPQRREASLASMCKSVLGIDIFKGSEIRCTFDQYLGAPVEDISEAHKRYAMDDVVHTFNLYCELLALVDKVDVYNTLLSHDIQIKGDLALDQMKKNGIGVNTSLRDSLISERLKKAEGFQDRLSMWGWIRGKPGNKDVFLNLLDRFGIKDKLPVTDKGNTQTTADALAPYLDIPFVKDYLNLMGVEKQSDYLNSLSSRVVHPDYNYLVETGRTSCSKPNFQNPPRGDVIRNCFIPKQDDKVFIDVDYTAIELSTLAQNTYKMFGHSKMRDIINDGRDLHRYFASRIYNKPEDQIEKHERQFAKIFNFGLGANMGAETFVSYAKPQGVILTVKESQTLKDLWVDAFPEMKEYFKIPYNVSECITSSGRVRGDVSYTAHLNTYFQGMAADGAKLALYASWKEGLHLVGFVHDSIVTEHSREDAEEILEKQSTIMVREMQKVVTDVKVGTEGVIKEVYS